jgi:hypothetical protein
VRLYGPQPAGRVIVLLDQVCRALTEAHGLGLIHRDIKPANIMILPSGEPKIMDFGIAKLEASQLTAAGQLFGTPLYMSPEQAQACPVDARSDLFSLGSVLHEMLTGRRAFAASSVHGVVHQVVFSDPPPPSSVVAGIPGSVDRIVARCLAKDPQRRYPSGRALADDVRAVVSGAPLPVHGWERPGDAAATLVSARRPPAAGPGRERPGARMLLAGVALASVVGAGYLAWSRLAPAEMPGPAGPGTGPEATPGDASVVDRITSLVPGLRATQVSLDFEHSLKSGSLRVFVDDTVVIDADLDSRVTKRVAGLTLRKGSVQDSFGVAPGRHEVRVRIEWEGNVKSGSIWANFQPGSTRRLEARLRGVGGLQDLSLKWR